jgi:hypothetical protein
MYCYNEIKIQVSISNDTLRKKTPLTKTCAWFKLFINLYTSTNSQKNNGQMWYND